MLASGCRRAPEPIRRCWTASWVTCWMPRASAPDRPLPSWPPKFHPYDHDLPLIMATAVELLHIATLVHDDTVDNSDVRRGKATVSSRWGRNVAVLVGDYVFATSATFVCDTKNVRVIRRFSETIMELSKGELSEIFDAFNWSLGRERYWQRIYEKTASLFSTAAESGAVLSGGPREPGAVAEDLRPQSGYGIPDCRRHPGL